MRGRVLILLGLIVLGGVAVGAILLLGGGDDTTTPTATPDGGTVVTPGGNTGGPTPFVPPDGGEEGDFEPVVIALQNLPRGRLITANDLAGTAQQGLELVDIRFWPVGYVPQTAVRNPLDLIGCQVRTDIPRESPILIAQLTPDPRLAGQTAFGGQICAATQGDSPGIIRYGSDAALLLEPGMVGISVPLDPTGLGQAAYGFQSGDRVDVNMSFLFIEVDERFQTRTPNLIAVITRLPDGTIGLTESRPGEEEPSDVFENGIIASPSEPQQRPRLVTQRTIRNALVIWVGWFPPDGVIYGATPTTFEEPEVLLDPTAAAQGGSAPALTPPSTPTEYIPVIMTLGVTPQDALVLTWAIDSDIPITYTLRPVLQDATLEDPTTAVSLRYILDEFDIEDPPIVPLAIEPAVTDIRRFDLSSLRTFSDLGFTE